MRETTLCRGGESGVYVRDGVCSVVRNTCYRAGETGVYVRDGIGGRRFGGDLLGALLLRGRL